METPLVVLISWSRSQLVRIGWTAAPPAFHDERRAFRKISSEPARLAQRSSNHAGNRRCISQYLDAAKPRRMYRVLIQPYCLSSTATVLRVTASRSWPDVPDSDPFIIVSTCCRTGPYGELEGKTVWRPPTLFWKNSVLTAPVIKVTT